MIFVDTGFLIALFNSRDRHHPRALPVFREFEGKRLPELLLTTDHVVFETVTFFVKKVSHERAVYVGERLYSEKASRKAPSARCLRFAPAGGGGRSVGHLAGARAAAGGRRRRQPGPVATGAADGSRGLTPEP